MAIIESSSVGLASEAFAEEKGRVPHLAESSNGNVSDSTYTPETKSQEDVGPVRQVTGVKWFFAYTSMIASVLLFALDGTISADIQPSIIETYNDTKNLPWIGVAFALGSISILPLGKAYGIFNIKWMFLFCVFVFEVGSVLCGAAPNMTALIIGRVLGGVGGAGVYSGGLTYISVTTNNHERPLYLSGMIVVWGLGSVLGPIIGGAFAASSATWRWSFYINLVVAAILAPAWIWCLPNINPQDMPFAKKLRTQDWVGIVIFCAGSTCFTMAVTFGGIVFPFNGGSEITLWVMTGVLLVVFALVTIFHPGVSVEYTLYPAHFVKRLELINLQYQLFIASGSMMISVYYTPLLFQFTRGDGPLEAGVRLLPLISMIVASAIISGVLMPKFGYYIPWYIFGNAMSLIGSSLMYTIDATTTPSRIYGYTALLGIGIGSFMTAGFAVVQALVNLSDVNNAVGFMAIGQSFGAITLLAIAGSLFQNIVVQKIAPILPNASAADIQGLTTGITSPLFKALTGDVRDQVIEQITYSLRNVFMVLIVGSAIGFIASFFLSRKKLYLQDGQVAAPM